RRNHPPAERTLKPAQEKEADQLRLGRRFQPSRSPEIDHRQCEDEADTTGQDTMRPLPPEDHLELVKAHPLVDLLVLRDLLVLFEFLVPLSLAHWRNDAMDGLPFGNGQPRLNQPRCPTNEDEGEKRGNHHIKPYAHPAA